MSSKAFPRAFLNELIADTYFVFFRKQVSGINSQEREVLRENRFLHREAYF